MFLFRGTVAENIADGTVDAKNKDMIMAVKVAKADDFIMLLPQCYETIVGERGQIKRQRIAN
ncbi:ABC transporter ATP-binding protein [Anabaena cylindrica PCC 7122]|nr:ABC transporter ATP-binding protein [Anabaena cylindrica PCC 7122]